MALSWVVSGSRASFDTLLAHEPFLRRLAWGLVGEQASVDDLVQDTLVAAVEHPPPALGLRAWLTTVLRNRVHDVACQPVIFTKVCNRSVGKSVQAMVGSIPHVSLHVFVDGPNRLASQAVILGQVAEGSRAKLANSIPCADPNISFTVLQD